MLFPNPLRSRAVETHTDSSLIPKQDRKGSRLLRKVSGEAPTNCAQNVPNMRHVPNTTYSKRKGITYFRNRLNALDEIVVEGDPDEAVLYRGFLNEFRCFRTILMLVILVKVLGEVNSLSEYVQSSGIILSKAIDVSKATVKSLEAMRSDACFSDL